MPAIHPRGARRALFTLSSALCAGCTALGPMPATTGISALPAARPDVELHAGVVPGYYLSSAVQENTKGAALPQVGGLVEPDRWLSMPGLIAGARVAGDSGTGRSLEPMLGYRRFVDPERRIGLGVVGFATHASASSNGAHVSATRGGGEALVDLRATPESHWLELHLTLGGALTLLSADGTYCLDAQGKFGIDCQDDSPRTSAQARGLYPSATGALALDVARHLDGPFHGGRITLGAAVGSRPSVVSGQQDQAQPYAAIALLLSLGLGGN